MTVDNKKNIRTKTPTDKAKQVKTPSIKVDKSESIIKVEASSSKAKLSSTGQVDKDKMEDILVHLKTCCNLFINATIESSTPKVHSSFESALTNTLRMQNETYSTMSQKGWYQVKPAPSSKITQTKRKQEAQG